MIDPSKIPTFTGNLEQLETHASSLKTTAGNIRTTGKDVHNAFQALDPVYNGPEEKELFASTAPVRDKADEFAKKLESVGGALQSFATEAKPLVDKMDRLRKEAEEFVAANKSDDDWKKDQKKVDQNARMVSEVGTTWVAFQGVERDAANKITALVDGTKFVVDDGSHQAGMYGFKESDVKDAKETPWGTVDKREYTGWRAAWEWTKDNVGGALKGFFVDGVWGTIKGLGSMVNVFDWDNFKKTWTGIGNVFGGVSAYLMTPYDWAMDKMFGPTDHSDTDKQKAALREFGKGLVAWDEWGKDPARAFGSVLFNGLTIGAGSLLKLSKAGEVANAGKVGAGARVAGVLGKAGEFVDPMSYLGKAAGVTKLKVGDFMAGLKASREGLDDLGKNIPTGTDAHPAGTPATSAAHPTPAGSGHPAPEGTPAASGAASAHPGGTPAHTSGPTHAAGGAPAHPADTPASHTGGSKASDGLHYTDREGNHRVVHGDGTIRDEHGNVVPDTKPKQEPHKDDLPNTTHEHEHADEHRTAPVTEPAKVLEGAGGPSHVEHAGGHPSSSHPSSSHPTSMQPANMRSGDGAHPTGGGTGGPNSTPHMGGGGGSQPPHAGGPHGPSGHGGPSTPAHASHATPGSGADGHHAGGHGSHGNDGSSHGTASAHHGGDVPAPDHGGNASAPDHGGNGSAPHHGADGNHTTPTPKSSTPADVAEQVKKANTNQEWFEKYYRPSDGHRLDVTVRDENGRKLPILRRDENGNWSNKFPPSEDATFKWDKARPGEMDKIPAQHLDDLKEAAERRQKSLDDLKKAESDHAAAEKAYKAAGGADDALKAKLDDLAKKLSEAHAEKTDATEMFGEKAAEYHAIPEHYPEAKRIDDRAKGNDRFDQIYPTKDGRYVVVEAKSAPKTELKDRWGAGPYKKRRVAQGTREYFETILLKMEDRGETELAGKLAAALEAGKLDYVLVKGNPVGKMYEGYLMNHFDIG
ncbi:hypothetical protein ACX9I7_02150 [Streptomyces sp. L500]